MKIVNTTAPIQSGTVYSTLNQPEIFVEYTGKDTDTTHTVVNNTTKTIEVYATYKVIVVETATGYFNAEEYLLLSQSTATKIGFKGTITKGGELVDVNVLCSASEARDDQVDEYYMYYGPEDANGYAYVVKVWRTKESGYTEDYYKYEITWEYVARMKETFVTGITVGALPAGSTVVEGTKVADLLQTILQGTEPVGDWKFKYLQTTTLPTEITEEWTTATMPSTAKTSGYEFNSIAAPRVAYICFAFTKEIGKLIHIYLNKYDELGAYFPQEPTELSYDGVSYYAYIPSEKSVCSAEDKFQLVWIDKEK